MGDSGFVIRRAEAPVFLWNPHPAPDPLFSNHQSPITNSIHALSGFPTR